jgi:GMP synthase (glutamine-hydrolysing)
MIGVLNAYHYDASAAYQEEYSKLFLDFVEKVFPEKKGRIKEYKVAQGVFPASVDECDVWFMTGSPMSVYDDVPWVKKLAAFTQEIHARKKMLVAICFGHQMVAHALGGKVSRSPKGWGVGVRTFEIEEQRRWMSPSDKKISLIFSHQDQVDELPPGAERLATSEFCPNQMSQIGEHIITLQGHPEFSPQFAKDRLSSRREKMPGPTYETAMQSFERDNDYKKMISWIRNFITEREI